MPLVESLIFALGFSVAKALAKSQLGEGFAAEVLPELLSPVEEWGKDKAAQRRVGKQLERLGQRVADTMQPVMDVKFGLLDESRKQAVVREAVTTLGRVEITAELVVKLNLNRDKLYRHLLASRPRATKGFSPDEVALYQLMLAEASRHILEIATHLSGFTGNIFAEVLEGQDKAQGVIDKVLAVIEKMAAATGEQAVEFEERYRDGIKETFDRMDLFGVRRVDQLQRRQSLSVSYITLQVERHAAGGGPALPGEIRAGERDPLLEVRMQDEWRSGPIDRMLTKSRRIIVRGEAGSGKTTLLRWIAVRSARRDFLVHLASWNATVPFFVRLRECVKDGFPAPENLPHMAAPMLAGGMPRGWVHEQLENGRALVLVDGVDELPKEKRDQMLQRLVEMVAAYPLARYIVSSRPSALKADDWPEWQDWINAEGFTEVALQPMGPEQIESFIDSWHNAVRPLIEPSESAEFARRPGNLKRLLRLRQPLRKLATSPLLCAMLCALHRERGDRLPSERITLYKECCEMLLSLREGVRGIDPGEEYPDLSDPQKQTLIQGFAYWLMSNGWSDVETGHADGHFEKRLGLMNLPGVTGRQVRRYFIERSSLLREPVEGRVDFTHRTFQEFMAAQEAVNNGDIGVLIKNAHDDQWREMIILAAGLARPKECERLLKGIINKGNRLKTVARRNRLHLLALACLETPVQIEPAVRAFVLDQAASLFPPKNFDEAQIVSAAGEPAIPLLTAKHEYDEKSAAACVRALTLIGSESALSAVEGFGSDSRHLVVEEIGRSWDEFDRREFARRVLSKAQTLTIFSLPSFEGFEHLSHLSTFHISSISLDEIAALSQFINPITLFVSGKINGTNLRPLTTFSNLKKLTLAGGSDEITDLSPLAEIQGLNNLFLTGFTSVNDLSPLAKLKQLRYLGFNLNSSINDISTISLLNNLDSLLLIGCTSITDLSPISRLRKLTLIDLYGCLKITDVSPLSSLSELTYLNIEDTGITDLSPLKGLKKLRVVTSGGVITSDDIG